MAKRRLTVVLYCKRKRCNGCLWLYTGAGWAECCLWCNAEGMGAMLERDAKKRPLRCTECLAAEQKDPDHA